MIAREYFNWLVEIGDSAGTMHLYEVRNLWSPKIRETEEAIERTAGAEFNVKMKNVGLTALTASATLQ